MRKKIIFVIGLIVAFISAYSLKAQERPARPDFPGRLLFEIGLNTLQNNEVDAFETSLFSSRTFNMYYLYDIRIMNSSFYLLPGFGIGLDKYGFDGDFTLDVPSVNPDTTILVDLNAALGTVDVKKSLLATNYFDIPLELRFYSNPDNPKSFRVGVGGKVGVLFSSMTKVKYESNDENIKLKDKRDFNVSGFRYGINGRLGIGSFNLFVYYGLNELFEDGDGPGASQMNQLSFGLSIVGF